MRPCPLVSVIIPGYNKSDLSGTVLQDVLRTADLPKSDYELIFVDDGSYDNTPEVVQQYPGVQYIRHPENKGVSPAWNTGIKAATGDFCIILNNDIRIADEHWMSKFVNALQHKKSIVGTELVDFNAASAFNGKNQPYLNGWAYAFPRRIFSELGLFEEAFAPASFEDVEYCTRATAAGYKLDTIDLRIQHSYSKTVNEFLRDRMPALNQRNRDIWLNKMQEQNRPRLKFVFDCPENMKEIGSWGPFDLEQRGLGGAETAITLLTRDLATRGHEVLLFNDINGPDIGQGVAYFPRHMISHLGLDCDVFVSFRNPSEYLPQVNAKRKIFWSCDQHTSGNWDRDVFPYVDTVVCISQYHADYLKSKHGALANRPGSVKVIGCPVRSWDYEPHADKNVNEFIFCSVPHRGLAYMSTVMREIRKVLPDAKLNITSDYRLWGAPDPRNDEFRPLFTNDNFLGKVDRERLIELQNQAMAYPYPCTYSECFCIAIAECATAGAVPISTDIGAVAQTVGESGFIVGPPQDDFAQRIAQKTLEIYGNTDIMRNSIEQSWKHSVVVVGNKWESMAYSQMPQEEPQAQTGVSYTTSTGDVISTR